jgi:large subunit ribosomal protein L10
VKKEDKERVVAELTERLRTTETLLVADYRGLTMPQIDDLRSKLIEHGARFSVVKNTLTRRAAEAAGSDALLAMLEGPTAIAFLESGGLLEGRPIEADEIESLAKLPPFDVLRSQVLGAITSPLTAIVGLFTAPVQDLYGLLDARIEQLREQGDTSEAAASGSEPEAVATVEEPAAEAVEPASEEASGPEPDAEATETQTETETEEEEQ